MYRLYKADFKRMATRPTDFGGKYILLGDKHLSHLDDFGERKIFRNREELLEIDYNKEKKDFELDMRFIPFPNREEVDFYEEVTNGNYNLCRVFDTVAQVFTYLDFAERRGEAE